MKKRIAILVILAVFLTANVGGVVWGTAEYPEDLKDHWAETAIEGNSEMNLLINAGEPLFYPEKPIYRKDFLDMLEKLLPDRNLQLLTDEGYISRDEAVALVADAIGYARNSDKGGYKDYDKIDNIQNAQLAKNLGILTGYRDGTFKPKNLLTRAESVVIIARLNRLVTLDKGFKVTRVLGKAYDGSNIPLSEGRIIYPGERINTKAGGQVVLTADDSTTIRVGPFSIIELEKKTDKLNSGESHTSLKVWAGKIFGRVQKLLNDKSTFEVDTPAGVAGIRGTTFAVGVNEDGSTKVTVYAGIVAVTKEGKQKDDIFVKSMQELSLITTDVKPATPQPVELTKLTTWEKNALEEALVEESEAVEAEVERNLNESQLIRLEKMLQEINETIERKQENQENENTRETNDMLKTSNNGNSNPNAGNNGGNSEINNGNSNPNVGNNGGNSEVNNGNSNPNAGNNGGNSEINNGNNNVNIDANNGNSNPNAGNSNGSDHENINKSNGKGNDK